LLLRFFAAGFFAMSCHPSRAFIAVERLNHHPSLRIDLVYELLVQLQLL